MCCYRYVSASCLLDYDTVAGADKFGNVWVLQLPYKANDDIDNPTGSRMLWDQGLLNGAPTKAQVGGDDGGVSFQLISMFMFMCVCVCVCVMW